MLTLNQLKRRGISLANRCFLCEEDEETIDHLLIHCSRAKILWDLILVIVGVSWVFPLTVWHSLLAWQGLMLAKNATEFGRFFGFPFCIPLVYSLGALCSFFINILPFTDKKKYFFSGLCYPLTIFPFFSFSLFFPFLFFSGFEALTEIQNLLNNNAYDPSFRESLIVDASNRFFTMIPSIHPHVIRDEDDFKAKVLDTTFKYIFHVFAPSRICFSNQAKLCVLLSC